MIKLIIMSNNPKKCQELQALVTGFGFQVIPYRDVLSYPLTVVEDGQSFKENAIKKVMAMPSLEDAITISDDSGLAVDALDNRPGIHSARYGGEGLSDQDRCHVLLREMDGMTHRHARFICVIAIRFPNGPLQTVEGDVHGTIATSLSGDSGFGYDPIFIPNGYKYSFATLGPSIKSKLSHRAIALQKAIACIQSFHKRRL